MGITSKSTRTALDTLPGASMIDPYAQALDGAGDAIDAIKSDPYSAPIVEGLRGLLLAVQKARRLAWTMNDALISQFSGAASIVEAQMEQARASVPMSGGFFGPQGNGGRDTAQAAAGTAQWKESKAIVANAVLKEFSGDAATIGQAVADAVTAAQEAVNLAGLVWNGPYSMRPDTTDDMAAKADSLEREIGRTGLAAAAQLFSAMVGKKSDRDLFMYAEAALRCIATVRTTHPHALATKFPSQGNQMAEAEQSAAADLYKAIDDWMAAHRPASITAGRSILVSLLAVASDLTGVGNAGGLSSGAFDSSFLYPSSQAAGANAINKYQGDAQWLARWLPPRGNCPPGYSPIAGRLANGLPFRFAAGAS